MMSLELLIRENCAGLSSDRVTDRKRHAESLKSVISGSAAESILTENTLKKSGITWDHVFDDVHDYIVKESEKFETSKTFESSIKPLAVSLLHSIVTGAKKCNALIKCERITTAVLFILKSNKTIKAFGDAYLNLLYKYVVSCDIYIGHISPETWDELLDTCITVCESKHLTLDYFTKLRLVWLIMKNGSNCCQFVDSLRDCLQKLQRLMLNTHLNHDKKIQRIYIDICSLLISAVSQEYRLTMCKFTETVLGTVIAFYDQNMEYKNKMTFFEMLHGAVDLHHPLGRLKQDSGSLAHNWTTWLKILNNIVELVHIEIKALQKSAEQKFRFKDDSHNKDAMEFYTLAAAVFYQVLNSNNQSDEVEQGPSKRQRLSLHNVTTVSGIIDELQHNHVPWLGIIMVYVKNYGDQVSIADQISLLRVLDTFISSSNMSISWTVLEQLTCLVLDKLLNNSTNLDTDNSTLLTSLWNSGARQATLSGDIHKAMHSILQSLLRFDVLEYQCVNTLVKHYFEKGMPVTNYSVKTLDAILKTFFGQYNNYESKVQCFEWLTQNDFVFANKTGVESLILRIVANKNIEDDILHKDEVTMWSDEVYETVFNTNASNLFSEFDLDITATEQARNKVVQTSTLHVELIEDVSAKVKNDLENILQTANKCTLRNKIKLLDHANLINFTLCFIDTIIKYVEDGESFLANGDFMKLTKTSLKILFSLAAESFSNCGKKSEEIELIKSLQLLLSPKYGANLNIEIRNCIDKEFFISIHKIINERANHEADDEVTDDDKNVYFDIKHHCILLLATYCTSNVNYKEELLGVILDPKLYEFSFNSDVQCAFQSSSILVDFDKQAPTELLFQLMQSMCKNLFRNPQATFDLLVILYRMLGLVFTHSSSTLKNNCFIMVNGFLQRVEKSFYPSPVAALVYKCLAKINELNVTVSQQIPMGDFKITLLNAIKNGTHSLRLYCSYLIKMFNIQFSHDDVEEYANDITQLFLVNISDKTEEMQRDELNNRPSIALHSFYTQACANKNFTRIIVHNVLKVHKEKSLNITQVKKVLIKITALESKNGIEDYFKNNVLELLSFWFSNKYEPADIPFCLLGYATLDSFIENSLKWLIPAETLWLRDGRIEESKIVKKLKQGSKKSTEDIIEESFCNIMALCLPYIVSETYGIDFGDNVQPSLIRNITKSTKNMFQLTSEVLGGLKWSNLFAENLGELVLLAASHLFDCEDANIVLGYRINQRPEIFHYPKEVFLGILKYFRVLINEDVMLHLCEQQPMIISKIIVKLWNNLNKPSTFANKVVSLYSLVVFTEELHIGYSSDYFVCNFSCNCLLKLIKSAETTEEIRVYIVALRLILNKYMPLKSELLTETIPLAINVLNTKKEEGYEVKCASLLNSLTSNGDELDGAHIISTILPTKQCITYESFKDAVKIYIVNLSSASYESIKSLKIFLNMNYEHVSVLLRGLHLKGFSEECKTSLVHQLFCTLNKILTSATDTKILTETCDCLSAIGTYDLKTLVMVSSSESKTVVDISPSQYFATFTAKFLSKLLIDESSVVSKVISTLSRLFQYQEGRIAYELGDVNKFILKQFLPTENNYVETNIKIDERKFEIYKRDTFWVPKTNESHDEWAARIATTLLHIIASNENYLGPLISLFKLKQSLSRSFLPPLLGLVISVSSVEQITIIGKQIDAILKYFSDKTSPNSLDLSGQIDLNVTISNEEKNILEDVLDAIDFVRLQRNHYVKRHEEVECLNYMRVDYALVSWAAAAVSRAFQGVYYGELAGGNPAHVLRQCYASIGEADAIEGCNSGHLSSERSRQLHLLNSGHYADALLSHDIALSSGSQDATLQFGVAQALHHSGMHHLAVQYIKSVPYQDCLADVKFECLTNLGDWSAFVDIKAIRNKLTKSEVDMTSLLKQIRYVALQDCFNVQITDNCDVKLSSIMCDAKRAISKLAQKLNIENCQCVYTIVSQIQMFNDIDSYYSVRCNKMTVQELMEKWRIQNLPPFQDFKHLESLISQRCLALEHAAKANQGLLEEVSHLQLQYAELALSNEKVQLAQRLVAVTKQLRTSDEVSLVESRISWIKGHKDISLSLLSNIIAKESPNKQQKAEILRQYGNWMAETKSENARDIIEKYLNKSLQTLRDDSKETKLKIYYDIARYADAEYKQVTTYMKSSVFENKERCLESMKENVLTLKHAKQQQSLTRDEMKALITNEKLIALDKAEIENTIAEKNMFLDLAMKYYLLYLIEADENNLSVFRVISLWLENPNFDLKSSGDLSFRRLIDSVPSRKYILVLPQLAPHLGGSNTVFTGNLERIILRCGKEHPHHTLPILFSLKNSDKDRLILNASAAVGGSQSQSRTGEPRVNAAASLIDTLARNGQSVLIAQMELLCDALISFANYQLKQKSSRQSVPKSETISKLKNLNLIPIPTIDIPISYTCTYNNLPAILSFADFFELVGGITSPKKIKCKGSDGIERTMLVKGQDDLRQDAVMQQVFNIVNTLLEMNTVTSKNKLLIRTYKVVPLSRRSGVLQWCEGTMPLGHYLVGVGSTVGAHRRYRPQDLSCEAARAKLTKCLEQGKPNAYKLSVFLKILQELKPVFHYFFTEHYLDPVTWYERRLAYTKSVATSSMVGYIMGLGDRHVQNILIDKISAEVVHIDFGIAFDQGKALPTPETIPFRLTQDLVAGFGSSGVEGIFRRSCEKTLQLLRDNHDALLTILEVLLFDPLYSWTPVESKRQQRNMPATGKTTVSETGGGGLAQRALLAVSGKLRGLEGGAGAVSAAGQVAHLIHLATNPANLCRLFPGWQPYL